jgi:hypothetical protein
VQPATGEGYGRGSRVEAIAGREGPVPAAVLDDGEGARDRRAVAHLAVLEGDAGDRRQLSEVDRDEGLVSVPVRCWVVGDRSRRCRPAVGDRATVGGFVCTCTTAERPSAAICSRGFATSITPKSRTRSAFPDPPEPPQAASPHESTAAAMRPTAVSATRRTSGYEPARTYRALSKGHRPSVPAAGRAISAPTSIVLSADAHRGYSRCVVGGSARTA